jgi:esterase/lipase superfamily enzyme
MNYDKHKGRSRTLIILTIFIFLIPVLSINHSQAQINESISFSDLNTGDTIYIITNRTMETNCENLSFNNDVNENTQLTFLKVTLNKSEKAISHLLNYDDFMVQVCYKTSDWLLFVHGDSKTYEQSVKRGFDIQKTHNINVIVFSWPSKVSDLTGLKNLNNSKHNVLKSMHHFNKLLSFMASFKKTNKAFNENAKLSMLLHSLGNLYLENLGKEHATERKSDNIFENIIINSAAVNQKMHNDWVEKINLQKRIYITNNKSDFNLKGKHIFSKDGNQLGEKAKNPMAKNANYVQFSKAVGFRFPTGTTHTFFIGNVPDKSKNIGDFYFDAFHGVQIDFSDQSQFIKAKKGVGYDIIF